MSKRLLSWIVISFVVITNITGCNGLDKEDQKAANSKTVTQETT